MNKKNKSELDDIRSELKCIIDRLETLSIEERESFDSLNEKSQVTERGQRLEQNADDLDDIIVGLQSQLDLVIEVLE